MTAPAGTELESLLDHPLIREVRAMAEAGNGRAYLVGGAVRDFLLNGALSADLDFTLIDCKAAALSQKLAESQGGHLVALDWQFGIHRVVLPAYQADCQVANQDQSELTVDFSDALENDLDTDLARRDLTINAMAIDLQSGALLDPFNGQADLANRRIRMVSEANLLDDTLRMLRVFRFAALLETAQPSQNKLQSHLAPGIPATTVDGGNCPSLAFSTAINTPASVSIDEATLAVIRQNASTILNSAAERIQYELLRMLGADRCFPALQAMADCGLLETILPELKPMRAIAGSGFHHLGLFEHTMELVRQAEILIDEFPEEARAWLSQTLGGTGTRLALVKLGCLLHDIGKPDTRGEREDPVHGTRLTFYGHEELGEQMAEPLLRGLKFSNEAREYLKKLIRWHLYPCQFGPDSPRKSVLRFYRRIGADTPDLILLALADRFSAQGAWLEPGELEKARQAHLWLLENYYAEQAVLQVPRLLNGHEVMQWLDLKPGPHLKEILDNLQEAQQLGEIHTPEEARAWLLAQAKQQ